MAADGDLVQLWIYDLSGGLARMYSQMLLGRQIEAIYHTSVVVGGFEHYFGGGINVAPAGSTPFGRPMQKLDLGCTQLPEEVRAELLAELSERYTPQAYSLFSNNCNNFSSEFAQLLVGKDIPSHITALPSTVLNTPFGQMIAPMLSGLEQQMRSMRGQAFTPAAATAPSQPGPTASTSAAAGSLAPSLPAATQAAVATPAEAQQQQQQQQGQPAAGEGPALHAAEVEIEAAVAAGMMREAEESTQRPHQQQQPTQDAAAAPAAPAAPAAADAARLAAELEIANEVRLLMAEGMTAHDAQAAAMEAAMARRGSQQTSGQQGTQA
ncbi:hypothetical protein ABPG77_002505 [Micractinium sp. CCAP 211/92]